MINSLLTLFAVGLVALLVVGVVLSVVGVVFSIGFAIAGFLLFKVAPILLVGWIVLKLLDGWTGRGDRLTASDRKWLEGS